VASSSAARPRSTSTAWLDRHGLTSDARRIALCGSPVELLLELAEQERPSLLVLGSRRLTTTERLFTTSTASTVAAYAPCPVAVVPPA
jgi:nucleotide-binding universal stress UspA family protein